ncbi:MAG TPA: acyl-CoA dehydrogenase family protein [Mycobacteriales bacterium]|jgi:alkylation response protein AidB-like acyl-CoA dehydrogenase|nr:acyl-CoA dehydrogenase family protein [Mycobacteriales bacterium]
MNVQFRYDPEHEELAQVVRRFLDEVSADADVRAAMTSALGWDPATVKRLAVELDVFGLAVPAENGGAGYGVTELGIVFQEAGRALLCAPLLSAALSSALLLDVGTGAAGGRAAELLTRIATGDAIVALATRQASNARQTGQGWRLDGTHTWVLDGHVAETFVVSATTELGPSLFLVDADDRGTSREQIETVDGTRRFATIGFADASAIPIGDADSATAVLERSHDRALILLAAEQVGIAERCLAMATKYAKSREQFGRPIGQFQAVKHKLASVVLEVEAALSAVMYAAWVADHDAQLVGEVARIAAYQAGEAAALAASENIQIHGGIGATWEHPAHLYLRRATVCRQLFGDPQAHLEHLAQLIEARA